MFLEAKFVFPVMHARVISSAIYSVALKWIFQSVLFVPPSAKGPYVVMKREFCVVDNHYGEKEAEESLIAERHLFCGCHRELLKPMIESLKCHEKKHDDKY